MKIIFAAYSQSVTILKKPKIYKWSFVICTLLVILISCKSDQDISDEDGMSNEDLYFIDYEPPLNKWGFIDTVGNMEINDQYDAARPFNNGLAVVNNAGKWGMIDKNNDVVIPFQFRALFPFKNGLARFQDFDQKYGFIDQQGQIVIEPTFREAHDFQNGLAKVMVDGVYGFINKSGKLTIEPQFNKASNFTDGITEVSQFDRNFLIDTSGEKVLDPETLQLEKIYFPSENIYRVRKNNNYGYFKNNKPLTGIEYEMATDFHFGQAAVMKNGSWMFIDTRGEKIKDLAYEYMEYGNEGKWMVNLDGKFGMVDNADSIVIPIEYDLLYKFSEGKCAYSNRGLWGYYDDRGNKLTDLKFALVWDFVEGKARALALQGLVVLDKNAEIKFLSPSVEMRDFSEGLAPIQIIN